MLGAVVAVLAALFAPAGASAASPVLEFVVPGGSLPVSFTNEGGEVIAEMEGLNTVVHCAKSHGEGKITGPRSTVSNYVFTGCVTEGGGAGGKKCKSADASNEEEITTGEIAAELVFINQAKHEVGVLLDPAGGTYIAFECGAETAEGRGPFLAPVSQVNQETTSFTASLSESGKMQTPDEYEGANGEKLKAIPQGKVGGGGLVATGVELSFTVHTGVPLQIRALSAADVAVEEEHARQAAEQAKHQQEEAAAKKHQEEAAAEAAKKQQEAAAKKQAEEAEVAAKQQEQIKALLASLKPAGKNATIGGLLKKGGFTLKLNAVGPGTIVIDWYAVPAGAKLAKKSKTKPLLVASGRLVVVAAGAVKIKIELTAAGRGLLKHAKQIKLTGKGIFTPTGMPPVTATKVFVLKR